MSVLSDPKLQYALPMENEIRLTYPFANLYFTFPTKPYDGNEIYFASYLKKITDTVSPEYTPTHVFGRSDPVATYKKTSRKISVEFDIPAYTEFDANEIMKKLNILIKNLYPGYLENRGQSIINSPPLVRLKYANIINNPFNGDSGLLGYPDNVAISHAFDTAGVFVFANENTKDGFLFAKSYSLTFGFTVLHEEVVGWDDKNQKFKTDNYPYKTVQQELIPASAKIGTAISNLRGSLVQSPAAAKGLTLVFGAG